MAKPLDFSPIGDAADTFTAMSQRQQQTDLAQRAMQMREEVHPYEVQNAKMGALASELKLNQMRREDEVAMQKHKAMSQDFDASNIINIMSQNSPAVAKTMVGLADSIGLFGTSDVAGNGQPVKTLNGYKIDILKNFINSNLSIQKTINESAWQDVQSQKMGILNQIQELQGKGGGKNQEQIAQLQQALQGLTQKETFLIGSDKALQEKMALERAKKEAELGKSAALEGMKYEYGVSRDRKKEETKKELGTGTQRETPEEAAEKARAKKMATIEATIAAAEKVLNRKLTDSEKKFIITRDLYGITDPGSAETGAAKGFVYEGGQLKAK